jgi:hypothetical protein
MDAFDSLRQAGTVDEPMPQVFERAEQILLEYIASAGSPTTPQEVGHRRLSLLSGWSQPHRCLSAAAVVLIAVGVALAAINPWGSSSGLGRSGHDAQVLSRSSVRLMVDATVAALNSGTAHMNITQSAGGSPVNQFSVDVTFSGANLDEAVTFTSYPPSQSKGPPNNPSALSTSTSDLRFVNGNAYRQLDGQWYVETGPNASAFLTFPNPRSFVRHIGPSADLVSLGQVNVGGQELTQLQARNPAVLGNLGIDGTADGTDTAFDVWVDSEGVVQRMTMTDSYRSGVCTSETTPATTPLHCTYTDDTGTIDIAFSNVGAPETVTAPVGAIPGSWPSN